MGTVKQKLLEALDTEWEFPFIQINDMDQGAFDYVCDLLVPREDAASLREIRGAANEELKDSDKQVLARNADHIYTGYTLSESMHKDD